MAITPGVGGLLTAIPNIVGGAVAKFAHNKYANLLEDSTLDMPSQYDEARGIYQKLAATGLPGVNQAKLDLMGNVPSTLKAFQSVADNPASIMGALADSQTGVNQGLTDLSIKDAIAKISNMQGLGEYMQREGSVAGEYDRYNNQLKLSAGAERMAGTAELLKGITGGVAGGISSYANLDMAKSFADMSKSTPYEEPVVNAVNGIDYSKLFSAAASVLSAPQNVYSGGKTSDYMDKYMKSVIEKLYPSLQNTTPKNYMDKWIQS